MATSEAMGVLLRGLPFEAHKDDINQFFGSLSISHSDIDMILTFDRKFSGLAFVRLRSTEDIKIALLMDSNHMGGRYIDVMAVSEEKLDHIKRAACNGLGRRELHRMCGDNVHPLPGSRSKDGGGRRLSRSSNRERSRSPVLDSNHDRFAYFNGFPDDVLYKGVRGFFGDCVIGKGCVHLYRGENGRFRGDGYVEFTNSTQLRKALRKDGMLFRNRRIDVEACARREVYDNLQYMMDRTGPNSPGPDVHEGYRRQDDHSLRHGNGERSVTTRDEDERDRWNGGNYRRHSGSGYHSRGLPDEGDDRRRHDGYRGNEYHGDERGGGYHRTVHEESSSYGDNRGTRLSSRSDTEGRTLRMHGIPSSARISDIVSFFRNYGVEYEDVRVQCHDDGTPNGRAFITFPSERISSAAYHDMNRRMMKSSYIELYPI